MPVTCCHRPWTVASDPLNKAPRLCQKLATATQIVALFRSKSSSHHPREVQTISPERSSTPRWILRADTATCHGRSALSFPISPVFSEMDLFHIDPLWRLFVIPWTITVRPRAPLYSPTRRSSQKRVLDIQLATVIAPSAMRRLATYRVQINIPVLSITYSLRIIGRSLGPSCQTTIISNPLMWCDFL